jgi:putative flavoprotein involved in K+ transport
MNNKAYDVIIIGAGQAGLSMGYCLKRSNLSFIILDKSAAPGEIWRNRYDSLTLFTPRSYSSLPGLVLSGSENIYPTKDEIADYLGVYAQTFSLPIQYHTNVQQLTQTQGRFQLITDQGDYYSQNVVVATGPFQHPFVPAFTKSISETVYQLHSSEYKNPSQLKKGSVLVVGGGNSGAQIAVELSKERKTYLSVGHKMKFLPQDIGKKSIFWFIDKAGLFRASVNSMVGRFLKNQQDPIFGLELKHLLKNKTVELKSKTISVEKDTFTFEDGSRIKVDNVIWSTGFTSDYSWIDISSVLGEKGLPIHERGITSVKGLFFLGLPWQHNRSSALIKGVGADAEYLLQHICERERRGEAISP